MPAKVVMSFTLVLALLASWFVVRWYVGNTVAEYFQPEENRLQMAEMSVALAPSDPLVHWRLAYLMETEFPPDQISRAVSEYEKAAALSPNDYRYWMHFGKALEQAGTIDRAEKAMRESVRLAPSYALPHWYLGNLLLRTDRYAEGFAELRVASEANEEFQPQLFNLAWQLNRDNFEELTASIGNTPGARAAFSRYLMARGKFDEGLRVWNSLTETEKRSTRAVTSDILASLIGARRFHDAVAVWNDVAPGPNYHAQPGHIVDAGFEDNIAHGPNAVFGWQVQQVPQVQIGIDPNSGHSGNRSLRILFQVRSHLDAVDVAQLVPVNPNTEYEFECYVKTERLESAATPSIEIIDAGDGLVLAGSTAAPAGNSNWQRVSLQVKTGANTSGIRVKVMRASCPESQICPIFGTVWYDDFDLKPRK